MSVTEMNHSRSRFVVSFARHLGNFAASICLMPRLIFRSETEGTHVERKNMQIVIESGSENQKIKEWGLLDFQGKFSTKEGQPIYNNFIGDLHFKRNGAPFFIVDQRMLSGQEVKLDKPFLVLRKEVEEGTDQTKYLVEAVIRRKIIFKTTPKPIICHPVNKNNG